MYTRQDLLQDNRRTRVMSHLMLGIFWSSGYWKCYRDRGSNAYAWTETPHAERLEANHHGRQLESAEDRTGSRVYVRVHVTKGYNLSLYVCVCRYECN